MADVTMRSVISAKSMTPAQEWALRWSIGIQVEEMGYEYPPHFAERRLCFQMGEEIRDRAKEIRDAARR